MAKNVDIKSAPDRIAVIPFYGAAAMSFLALCSLLALFHSSLSLHYFNPQTLALAHCAALGWGTMVIFGAAYQLTPVITGNPLSSPVLAFVSFICLLLGTIFIVLSFLNFIISWHIILGGSLVVLASLMYLVNIWMSIPHRISSPIQTLFLISSALWLCVTTISGLLLAINLQHHFIPREHLELLKLHAHAGLAGWFLQLICGVSSKLIPMFLLAKTKNFYLLYWSLGLQNIGLVLFLIDGYKNGVRFSSIYFAITVAIGVLLWAIFLYTSYKARLRKKTDVLMKQSLFSFVILFIALGMMLFTFFNPSYKWASLYIVVVFLGWITGLILPQTFKTLPFIVWNITYKGMHGKAKIPMPKQLYNEKLISVKFYLYLVGLFGLFIGLFFQIHAIITISSYLLLLLAIAYCYNVYKIILHKINIS